MANWKKVIVSGSSAELSTLQVDNLTSGVVIGDITGSLTTTSINGSGSIVATTDASGLSHSGSFSGSFEGSFSGDGSGLINISGLNTSQIATGSVSASVDVGDVSFLLRSGSTDFISVSKSGSVTVGGDLIVGNNLTVNGTTVTVNTENLLIEDKFALFASGSTAPTDGGIIVQSNSAGTGYALGYTSGSSRWVLEAGLSNISTTFTTPNAFVGTVEVKTVAPVSSGPLTFDAIPSYGGNTNGHGTLYIHTKELEPNNSDIWIFA
jgi:hypothetical protein